MIKFIIAVLFPILCFSNGNYTDYTGNYKVMTKISLLESNHFFETGMVTIRWQVDYMDEPVKKGIMYIPLSNYLDSLMCQDIKNPFFFLENENDGKCWDAFDD